MRYSFDMIDAADRLEKAIATVLDKGLRTSDIMSKGMTKVGTSEMGDAVIAEFEKLSM
jgi:3-isopropylmalate dehydrogenase